jgi:hypothetical protein
MTTTQTTPPIFGLGVDSGVPKFSRSIVTGAIAKPMVHDYTFYFNWLQQTEDVLAECQLSGKEAMQLTNKHLHIDLGHRQKALPLNQLQNLELVFKRLMFPLLVGGIVAPISLVALLNGLLAPLIGIGLSSVGLSLLYYGWVGTYQIRINLKSATFLAYFADSKTAQIERFIEKINRRLQPT